VAEMASAASKIVLTDRFDETVESFKEAWPGVLFLRIDADDFLVEHAKEAVEKAMLTSDREKVVVLSARFFTPIAQNKLLKILEEPPSKTHFLLLTPSKSGLLPTIRSRLPVENRMARRHGESSGVDLRRFDLERLFEMLQEHRRIDAKSAAELVENLGLEAMQGGACRTDGDLLRAFEESLKLLDMGSPPGFVLTRLGIKLLGKRR